MRTLIVLLALAAVAGTAIASGPRERLARARDDVRSGKFPDAVQTLNHLLYPEPKLAQKEDIIEAHLLYGVALFETGERKDATREVEAALFMEGDAKLDPQLFSEDVVAWFNETKAAKQARDKIAADARALAEREANLNKAIGEIRVVEQHQYWVNFMPFGAGQFQNGQTKKGIFFAATEAAAAGTSIAIFAYLTNKYGYGGQVPGADAAGVRRLQQVAIGANVVFYGVAIVGVIDALRNFKARAEIEVPSDLRRQLQRDADDTDEKPKPRPRPKLKESRLHLHPLPFPDGAGVGLTWEH